MKKLRIILIGLILVAKAAEAQSTDTASVKKDGIQTIQIKTSAVCEMCKETIEKAMAFERGVKDSNLDVDSKILTVKYDSKKTTPQKIKKSISMTGYDADEIPADSSAYEKLDPCCKKDVKH